MGTSDVADRINVTAATIRVYLKRSRKRVADGLPLRPQDLPLPDITIGQSPAWRTSTIETWVPARPGPGRRRET
jgi:hypothetical protein